MTSIEARILEIVGGKTERPPTPTDTLDDLGIDSLAMAELIYEIETNFGIESDDDLLDLSTIRELCQYVSERTAAHSE
jgi:acyl carrier protein